ncbi:MAG: ATP-binding protein, partial [Dehalococcoidia bacterium]
PLSWEPGVVAGAMEVYLPYAPYGDQIASRTRLFLFLAPSLALALVAAFYVFFYTGWRAIRRARESALREELERKRAEGALRESEARSRALLEAIPDMMLRVRRDGTITDFKPSRRAEPFVSSAEFLGKNVSELLPPEVARQTMLHIERALKDGNVELFDYQLQGNAEVRDFEARIVASGAAEVTVIARDITKRKQAEKRIEVLYEGEKKLRQEVESEIQRRAEFTRALVHEIKTPLIPVLASSELLVDELKGEPWSSLAKNIYRGATNLNDRIDGLLDVARGEMGMLESDLKPLYPLPLLQEVAGDMTAVAMSRSQSMSLDLPDSVPIVRADKGHLRQVLLNLLGNASKFTPEGGRITLSVAREDRYLIFSVRDTGPGIGEEARDQLFKAYYQVETSGPRRHGLGLGLTLCKNLVELHGGQIWVESQVGTGTTFSFSIPVEVSDQPAETPALAA